MWCLPRIRRHGSWVCDSSFVGGCSGWISIVRGVGCLRISLGMKPDAVRWIMVSSSFVAELLRLLKREQSGLTM
ncbi:hypothetical protein B0O80DRAFT_456029 [Mortierella sp. GBAus27b]|nr:hypothetical protein B0O80DRAFT_456029 [Mortierella sp. GBAus27b]